MSGRIPQSFIDELIARADIVELIGRRVALTKAGREYKAPCPFHDEKTPSFTVSPQKDFYHCFGCGAHGSAIGFLMNFDNLGFIDAVEALAEMLGVPVPRDAQAGHRATEGNRLYDVLAEADRVYRAELKKSTRAIDYLKNRGIEGPTAARFAMGYAPDAWDFLLRRLGTDEARRRLLVDAGLVKKNEQGRHYDRFRNRIMFPIRDRRGRVVAFGGRVLGDGEPKYLNSPETPVFHKGQALYGVYEAQQSGPRAVRPDEILVVEGYLDVAALAQHGIGSAVATLGTATTVEHIRRLTRIAQRVVFCFDGDRAGRAAAWRAMETALPQSGGRVEFKFLLLPEGEDPDSLVRAGGARAFREHMETAAPLSDFLLRELRSQVDLSSADGRSRLVALARPLLSRLHRGVYRELLIRQMAETIGVGARRLEQEIEALGIDSHPDGRRAAGGGAPKQRGTLIRRAIGLVLNYPAIGAASSEAPDLTRVDLPGIALLRQLLEAVAENPGITTGGLLERFRTDPEGRHLGRLLDNAPLDSEEAASSVLKDMLGRIVADHLRTRLEALLAKPSLPTEERAEVDRIQERLRTLSGELSGQRTGQ